MSEDSEAGEDESKYESSFEGFRDHEILNQDDNKSEQGLGAGSITEVQIPRKLKQKSASSSSGLKRQMRQGKAKASEFFDLEATGPDGSSSAGSESGSIGSLADFIDDKEAEFVAA